MKTVNKEVENKVAAPLVMEPVVVAEPVVAVEPVTQVAAQKTIETSAATVGASSLSMFSPWRILGYTDGKAIPAQENRAHTSLADLTKASVEQVLAENNVSTYTPK